MVGGVGNVCSSETLAEVFRGCPFLGWVQLTGGTRWGVDGVTVDNACASFGFYRSDNTSYSTTCCTALYSRSGKFASLLGLMETGNDTAAAVRFGTKIEEEWVNGSR